MQLKNLGLAAILAVGAAADAVVSHTWYGIAVSLSPLVHD